MIKMLLPQIDLYFLGRLNGETGIPSDEKAIRQFIVRGNLAGIDSEEAKYVIDLACEVIKLVYLTQVMKVMSSHVLYVNASKKYLKAYAQVNQEIRAKLLPATVRARQYRSRLANKL
jgi:hypothetical protein